MRCTDCAHLRVHDGHHAYCAALGPDSTPSICPGFGQLNFYYPAPHPCCPKATDGKILVRYYCGYYKANTGGLFTEPAECTAEGMAWLEIDPEDWAECGGSMACPACGAELSDGYGLERI